MRFLILVGGLTFAGYTMVARAQPHRLLTDEQMRVYQRDLPHLAQAVTEFELRVGRLPTDKEGINALVGINGISEPPLDPWGAPYRYELADGGARIWSLGRDQKYGGEGPDADLEVWVLSHPKGKGGAPRCVFSQ